MHLNGILQLAYLNSEESDLSKAFIMPLRLSSLHHLADLYLKRFRPVKLHLRNAG